MREFLTVFPIAEKGIGLCRIGREYPAKRLGSAASERSSYVHDGVLHNEAAIQLTVVTAVSLAAFVSDGCAEEVAAAMSSPSPYPAPRSTRTLAFVTNLWLDGILRARSTHASGRSGFIPPRR